MDPCPASAVVPLGTGNGLSINFGWGKTMRANWIASNDLLLEVDTVPSSYCHV